MECFVRAYHNETSAINVIRDEKSKLLLTEKEYEELKKALVCGCEKSSHDSETFRTRAAGILASDAFIEDAALTAFTLGCKQYVSLGSGLESFAVRHTPLIGSVRFFEADTPENISDKKQRLDRAGIDYSFINFVECDFEKEPLSERLAKTPFEKFRTSFFNAAGLCRHLNRKELYSVLKQISDLSSEGSSLCFSYRTSEKSDTGTTFGNSEIHSVLSKLGFRIYELSDGVQLEKRFFSLFNKFNSDSPLHPEKGTMLCLAVKKC